MKKAGGFRNNAAHRATRLRCDCGGYHFPHRKGSGACEHSIRWAYYAAIRSGCSQADALALLNAQVLEFDYITKGSYETHTR